MTHYIQFCGNIGAGKSTLASLYAVHAGFDYVAEPTSHLTFVDDFYSDMARWSFHHQLEFLLLKGKQERQVAEARRGVCQDRSLAECFSIFATQCRNSGWISDREWRLLSLAYELVATDVRRPDLRVFLTAPVPTLKQRIARRGRLHEANVTLSWLTALNEAYAAWIRADAIYTLVVDTQHLDFANTRSHQTEAIRLVEEALQQGTLGGRGR